MKIEFSIADKICTIYKDFSVTELAEVRSTLKRWDGSGDLWAKTQENMRAENHGSTIVTDKHILVILSPQTSKAELLNTLAHETRHIVDSIVTDDKRSAAELTGNIFSRFAEWL